MSGESSAQACEAYVIETDGTRRSIPINFADATRSTHMNGSYGASNQSGEHPIVTFVHRASERLHNHKPTLASRLFGVALIALGIPMLILPGPGIAAIIIGLALLFRR